MIGLFEEKSNSGTTTCSLLTQSQPIFQNAISYRLVIPFCWVALFHGIQIIIGGGTLFQKTKKYVWQKIITP